MGSTYKHLGEKKLINKEHVGRGRKKRKKKMAWSRSKRKLNSHPLAFKCRNPNAANDNASN